MASKSLKPSCFASGPSLEEMAERDCDNCDFKFNCFAIYSKRMLQMTPTDKEFISIRNYVEGQAVRARAWTRYTTEAFHELNLHLADPYWARLRIQGMLVHSGCLDSSLP